MFDTSHEPNLWVFFMKIGNLKWEEWKTVESYLGFLILPSVSFWFMAIILSQHVQQPADLPCKPLLYLLFLSHCYNST